MISRMNKTFFGLLLILFSNLLILSCSEKLHLEEEGDSVNTALLTENDQESWRLSCTPFESEHMTIKIMIKDTSYEEIISFHADSTCNEQNVNYRYRIKGVITQTRPHPSISGLNFLELTKEAEELVVISQAYHNQFFQSSNTPPPPLGTYGSVPPYYQVITPQFHIITFDTNPNDQRRTIMFALSLYESYDNGISANLIDFNAMTQQEVDSFPVQVEKI